MSDSTMSRRPAPVTPEQIRKACEGDVEQLKMLCREIFPAIKLQVVKVLYRRARTQGRDPQQDIEDFAHDALAHLLSNGGKRLRAWNPARGLPLASFVRLLTRRHVSRVLDGYRGNPWAGGATGETNVDDLELEPDHSPFNHTLSQQQFTRLMNRLDAYLDDRGLVLFELHYVEQRPVSEVAQLMAISREAFYEWRARLKRFARRIATDLERNPHSSPPQERP